MKRFCELSLLITLSLCVQSSFGIEECTTEVRSKLLDGTLLPDTSLSVTVVPQTALVSGPDKTVTGTLEFVTNISGSFYKKVEVSSKHSAGNSEANLAFFEIWPCAGINSSERILDLALTSRTGSAREVKNLRDDQSIIDPQGVENSLRAFAKTIGTALSRYKNKEQSNKRLLDLYSTYFALRSFDHLSKESDNIILGRSTQIKKIYNWHLDLISKVDINRIPSPSIRIDILEVGSELNSLSNLYSKYRKKILASKDADPKLAYETYQRYREKLLGERDSIQLRGILGINKALLTQELSSLAGAAVRRYIKEPKLFAQIVTDQTSENRLFLNEFSQLKTKPSSSAKKVAQIEKDFRYLKTLSRGISN
jgi:hypothetical protein